MRRCANAACGKVIDPVRVAAHNTRFCDDRCRAAAWKRRTGYGRATPPARPRASGIQLSYRKASDELTVALADGRYGWSVEGLQRAREHANAILRPALSDRQRAQLDARESSRPVVVTSENEGNNDA